MRVTLIVTALLAASLLAAAPATRRTPPDKPQEMTVQLKLRDLLDAIPRKEAGEIAARLKAIEERLTAIEAKLQGPAPLPAPEPLGKPQ